MTAKAKRSVPAGRAASKLSAAKTVAASADVPRVLNKQDRGVLELRDQLEMTRDMFARLVDVSVRTIAQMEASRKPIKKLTRNYIEVKRLHDALLEVVDAQELSAWFVKPNRALGGLKPIEAIERGKIDRLWDIVFRLRSGIPG